MFNASGILANGASSATIHLTTGGETYLPGVVTFATELFAPRLIPAKSAVDLNGGAVQQGDVIEYSIHRHQHRPGRGDERGGHRSDPGPHHSRPRQPPDGRPVPAGSRVQDRCGG